MILKTLAAAVAAIGFSTAAIASTITYDIEFSTPVFSSGFSELNTAISGFGPTITGSVTLDTSKAFVGSERDSYTKSDGGFVADLEWDSVFSELPSLLQTTTGTTVLERLRFYTLTIGDKTMSFDIDFPANGGEISARYTTFDPVTGFSLQDGSSDVSLQTFTVTERISAVPLPAGFPLLLAALGGLAVLRRKQTAAA